MFCSLVTGEHVYDGVLFFGYTPADTLDAVKEFEVRDDDVIIATYPKAGKRSKSLKHLHSSLLASFILLLKQAYLL